MGKKYKIRVMDEISLPGGLKNEDYFLYNDNTVVFLDGSSGLSADAPDSSWFVRRFATVFLEWIAKIDDLCICVNVAIRTVYDEFLEAYPDHGDNTVFPSASVVIAHVGDGKLQLLNLGDCTTLLFGEQGVTEIYDTQVDCFDDAVIAKMMDVRQQTGEDIATIVQSKPIRELLLENRRKMNMPGGYEILSFHMRPRTITDLLTFDIAKIHRVVMFTDGFKPMEEALLAPDCPKLALLYDALREEEMADASLNKRPRFKIGDDASGLIFSICEQ